jgi:integrase
MPRVKARCREEEQIIRDSDMGSMLEILDSKKKRKLPLIYKCETRKEKLIVNYDMVKCLLCLLYIFGRRLSGILQLKRSDFWTKKGYLYARFKIFKKNHLQDKLRPKTRVKRVNIKRQWKYVRYIIDYISKLETPDKPLFPGKCKAHTQIVKRKDPTGQLIKTYKYEVRRVGLMSRQRAYKIIKALNADIYPHWFRHSLATQLAEEGIDAWQLMNWFDWDRFSTANRYVSGTSAMTRDISEREIC